MGTRSGPDTMILDAYRSCGWKYQGFDTGYGKVVNRWNWIRTFDGIKDEKTLLASYKPRTRWSVNRAKTSGVQIRELTADDLGMFASIEQKTARRADSRPATKTITDGSRKHSEAEPISCSLRSTPGNF